MFTAVKRPLIVTRLLFLALALLVSGTNAIAAQNLLTPIIGGSVASPQFEIKSAPTPIMLNRAAMAELKKNDEFEFVLPNATRHLIVFDRIEDHGGGMRSSVGYLKSLGKDYRTIITTGPSGTFGSIRTADNIYRIVPGQAGLDLLVDMAEENKYVPLVDLGDDSVRAPEAPAPDTKNTGLPSSLARITNQTGEAAISLVTPTPQVTVDLMIVYTNGLATQLGAGLLTRFNNLVTAANTAYIDSEVAITLRLVNTTMVNYTDAPGDLTALNAITPVSGGGMGVFANIESIRTANGADMVAFLRNGAPNGGSGIAWLTTSATPNANYMYSVTTGCTAGCDQVFIHELGHNMGNAHDRATAAFQAGGVAMPPAGSKPYSFGHYFCASGLTCDPTRPPGSGGCSAQPVCSTGTGTFNNIGTIMSYFNPVTLKFSNPNVQCMRPGGGGSQPCGVANQNDNARSMNEIRVALQNIKASVGIGTTTTIGSSQDPTVTGQSITFTSTVSGLSGTPTGVVTFRDAGNIIAGCDMRPLAGGSATCVTAALAQGNHSITATYGGSATYNTSTSSALSQTVNAASFLLNVAKAGSGVGQVTSSPAGINTATNANSATFNAGVNVTLTATPQGGSNFTNWSGGGCTTNPTCVIAMNQTTSVTATFSIIQTVPGAPTIGSASPGNAQAMITFAAPASDGGAAITNYTTTCNPGALTASAAASPINIGGLNNGTTYTCAVAANNAIGASAASGTVDVTPSALVTASLVGAVSRKTHTGLGTFDVVVDIAPTIPGAVTVEPRIIGAGHVIRFQFNNTISVGGSVAVVDNTSATVGASSVVSGNDIVVTIPTLADNKRLTFTLTGVNVTVNPPPVSMGFLIGDVNNSRSVNASDISGVKARSGQVSSATNFRFDVNASGAVNASDISAAKARSGLVLP